MGHDKLRKFAENETFSCLVQPRSEEVLGEGGFFDLCDHPLKGRWRERFGGRPIVLELGCGKGDYTVALAERNPDKAYIGVDIKGARLWKGAKYVTEKGIDNVAFLRTRIEFITAFFAPGEISEIWLTFSDPQMKSENSRLSSPRFLERYLKFLEPGGVVHLKTDSRFLYEYTLAVCKANDLEVLCSTVDLYGSAEGGKTAPEVREVQTFYEKMFLDMGLPINYLKFVPGRAGSNVSGSSDEVSSGAVEPVCGPAWSLRCPLDPEEFDSKSWREFEGTRRSFGHAPRKS